MTKHVFWQALIVAFLVFWAGILIGIIFENSRVEVVKEYYFDAQTDISDFILTSNLYYKTNISCERLIKESIYFADKIYKEAEKLEKYDSSNRITERLETLHRRYDFLRTLLWSNLIQVSSKCKNNVNRIVYLYQYKDVDIKKKGIQGAISNLLTDIKKEYKDNVILIPIAADSNLESLKVLMENYNITKIPSVLVNEKYKFENLEQMRKIKNVLK